MVVADVGKDDVIDSGLTTETPVELGDNGDAIIGAGIVCRLSAVGVTYGRSTTLSVLLRGVFRTSSRRESFVGEGEDEVSRLVRISMVEVLRVSNDSARARSSHFPLTASKLAPTRCVGAHLRVAVFPVGEAKIPFASWELERDREPLPREVVRSSRRVW